MKKMTCSDMGGCCDTDITGETADELSNNGKEHVNAAADSGDEGHARLLEKMKSMSEDEIKAWRADFDQKFAEAKEAEEEF